MAEIKKLDHATGQPDPANEHEERRYPSIFLRIREEEQKRRDEAFLALFGFWRYVLPLDWFLRFLRRIPIEPPADDPDRAPDGF